jgi:hypothetical protein
MDLHFAIETKHGWCKLTSFLKCVNGSYLNIFVLCAADGAFTLERLVCRFPSATQSQIGNWSGKITTKQKAAAVGGKG